MPFNQPGSDVIQTFRDSWPSVSLWIPTFSTRGGPASDGVLVGGYTPQTMKSVQGALTGGTVYTDLTATDNAGSGTTWNLAALNDAIYFGATVPFSTLKTTIGTAGSYSATTLWEYWNGSAWVNLATSNLLLDSTASSGAFKATAGTYFTSWNPPTDWVGTTVNGVFAYYVRVRVSAFTSVATAPVLTQTWTYNTNVGNGLSIPVSGQLRQISFAVATTESGSNNDTKLLIGDATQGGYYLFTATKAKAVVVDSGPTLFTQVGDQLTVQMLKGDGSTEYAGVNMNLVFQPLS